MKKVFFAITILLVTLTFATGSATAANWNGQMFDNDPPPPAPPMGPYAFDLDVTEGVITYDANFIQMGPNYVGFAGTASDYIGHTWYDVFYSMDITIWDIHEDLNEAAGTLSGYVRCGPSFLGGDAPGEYADYQFTANAVPIPGAIWLLGSGLFGIVAFRKKIRKV